ncbi:hypothetical protein PTSG_09119 [Salpingoeca rosetta]|uniref:Complex 1 LYR protein domain-containing protein n=1 Tax=Salpingoeca rosetta (strain ATCC 50818 / BSB-021) TaxID=946362 RepID=F2UMS4_SALR5|nr:uncharacterized protein PTSG_09119 [Salpingoeca rosetta]EGD78423.1 hypothetical protein PTSG_09119 [Salpingoeca rosetta]|eukprot:XP_004989372.1 hypothetical protein PTSG_09119 [Salpingoeca rosetta]
MVRAAVLGAFRRVMRARAVAFQGDEAALTQARSRIRDEFLKNRKLSDEKAIDKAVAIANDVEKLLLQNVMQARQTDSGTYRLRFTEHTKFNDNVPMKESA